MGQFDKQQAPNAGAQKKKAVVAVLLAAGLAVVLGLQFFKSSPRAAVASPEEASPSSSGSAIPDPQHTVSEEIAALQNDPTSSLLHGANPQDASLLVAPRDPFRMSPSMHDALVKPAAPVTTPVVDHAAPHVVPVLPQAPNLDGLKLQGIFLDHQKPAAIVNGSIVHAGMTVGNVFICSILEDRIVVQNPSFPTGPKVEVLLKQ